MKNGVHRVYGAIAIAEMTESGETTSTTETVPEGQEPPSESEPGPVIIDPPSGEPRKFYFDGGQVEVVARTWCTSLIPTGSNSAW